MAKLMGIATQKPSINEVHRRSLVVVMISFDSPPMTSYLRLLTYDLSLKVFQLFPELVSVIALPSDRLRDDDSWRSRKYHFGERKKNKAQCEQRTDGETPHDRARSLYVMTMFCGKMLDDDE